ncbi:MAG: hypothetical protein MJ071_01655 [Oscillospiraceae bacterium]|nr:hypothetical protein [Oscillospiraceae bacterium]
MANYFSIRRSDSEDETVSISDQGTNVLISVLLLAGTHLAETDSQKRLIVWLAEHDRKIGSGMIGFCLAEMPWNAETFETDRQFMVRVVDAASRKTDWDKLNYVPNEPNLRPILGWFRKGFSRLRKEDVNENVLAVWLDNLDEEDPGFCEFPKCRRHGIFETWVGCQICNCK